jgi:hypothetical protein
MASNQSCYHSPLEKALLLAELLLHDYRYRNTIAKTDKLFVTFSDKEDK